MQLDLDNHIPAVLNSVLDRDLPDELLAVAVADRARLMAGDGAD